MSLDLVVGSENFSILTFSVIMLLGCVRIPIWPGENDREGGMMAREGESGCPEVRGVQTYRQTHTHMDSISNFRLNQPIAKLQLKYANSQLCPVCLI